MPNLIDVVVALAEIFDRLQLRFALGGAIANNYWGIVRATRDIDCLISLPKIKYQLFADELNASGCTMRDKDDRDIAITVPRLSEQVQQRKLIECYQGIVRIELFVPAVALQDEILRRVIPVRLNSHEVSITTAEDLILLKLVFHRVKDIQDVRGILWLQRGRLDLDYMRHWSARTHEPDVQKELERLIAEYSQDKTSDS
jgi:predicted nucleotidyltransferase